VAFGFLGVVLLLGPDVVGGALRGAAADPFHIGSEVVFIVIGCVLVWVLAGRIVDAFLREAAQREAVERRENVLAEVLDAVPAAVLVLDGPPTDPVVGHANPAAASLFGVGAGAVAGRRLVEVCPLDAATVDLVAAAIAAGHRWSGERLVATGEARRLPLSLAVTPIRDAAGRAVLVATDQTAIRFAERESERLATELEGFVDGAPLGFVTVGPDGLVAGWNPAAERILGRPAAEMLGRRLPDELGAAIAGSLASGGRAPGGSAGVVTGPDDEDVRLHRRSGDAVTIRLTATTAYGRGHEFFGFTAMFEDVTDRRNAELQRDEAEARFRAAVDAAPVPLVLLDPAGRVRFWSAAAERVFGWSADEALGELFPPVPAAGWARFAVSLDRVLAGEMVDGDVIRYVRRDGRRLPVRVWSSPVRAPDGTIIGLMGAFGEIREPDVPDD
jgi:PAS domain S-box-containing protein